MEKLGKILLVLIHFIPWIRGRNTWDSVVSHLYAWYHDFYLPTLLCNCENQLITVSLIHPVSQWRVFILFPCVLFSDLRSASSSPPLNMHCPTHVSFLPHHSFLNKLWCPLESPLPLSPKPLIKADWKPEYPCKYWNCFVIRRHALTK